MAISGPKVGSSAKAETGKASMVAAAKVVGINRAFKMSELIGKSMANVKGTYGAGTGNERAYGLWSVTTAFGLHTAGSPTTPFNVDGYKILAIGHLGGLTWGFVMENKPFTTVTVRDGIFTYTGSKNDISKTEGNLVIVRIIDWEIADKGSVYAGEQFSLNFSFK